MSTLDDLKEELAKQLKMRDLKRLIGAAEEELDDIIVAVEWDMVLASLILKTLKDKEKVKDAIAFILQLLCDD